MPKCKSFEAVASTDFDSTGAYRPLTGGDRLASVSIRKSGLTFSVNLGGIYETQFRSPEGSIMADSDPLLAATRLVWSTASFIGRHRILGDVKVQLGSKPSTGFFESVGAEPLPAINTNEFFFQIELPRLRAKYANTAPLINRAEISAVPPVGALYELAHPLRFFNVVDPNDWCDITKCYVVMPDQKDIDIEVTSIALKGDRYHVQATLKNRSQSRSVDAYWFTHSDDPANYHYEPDGGALRLGRTKKLISFDMVFVRPPADPTIQIGAALISNPLYKDPRKNTGTQVLAVNINKRSAYLRSSAKG